MTTFTVIFNLKVVSLIIQFVTLKSQLLKNVPVCSVQFFVGVLHFSAAFLHEELVFVIQSTLF